MNINKEPQSAVKYDYSSLFLSAILLIGTAAALDGLASPVGRFFQGMLIGMSIACSVIGLALYAQSQKRR